MLSKLNHTPDIAVIGGGIMGISTALKLAKKGAKVTLFERDAMLGGLSAAFNLNSLTWDRYYHVVLSTDIQLIQLLKELGLENDLFWKETKTGFYGNGRLVSMSSTMDFVTFPFMTLWQKFRMGLGIIYSTILEDPSKLDRIYVRTWLTKVFGRRVYEKIWEPLLRSKLGDAREMTSAAFIWATIKRLYGARNSGSKIEKMGHVHGGYARILEKAEELLLSHKVEIKKSDPVLAVSKNIKSNIFNLQSVSGEYQFDKVIMTNSCPNILQIIKNREKHSYWDAMENINYLGVACVLLILSRSLSPYYVINLLDEELPFTGIIEATNVVSPEELGGHHLVYLPKYMPKNDKMAGFDDDELAQLFTKSLQSVFPDLKDEEIKHTLVFREPCVQPLQELYSLERKLDIQTPISGLYVANTSMILNSTLNNNAVITLAKKAADIIQSDKYQNNRNNHRLLISKT